MRIFVTLVFLGFGFLGAAVFDNVAFPLLFAVGRGF